VPSDKGLGDIVIITGGVHRGKSGLLVFREQRGWTVELENGDMVLVNFPYVKLKSDAVKESLSRKCYKELQTLAKEQGIPISRSKTEIISIILQKNPQEDVSRLTGTVLLSRIYELHISRLKSKSDLLNLLSKK
jgi:hypothetical protein